MAYSKESTPEGERIVKTAETLFGELGTLRTTLEDITSYLMPQRMDVQTKRFEGQNDRVQTFLSHVPAKAMDKLVSGLVSDITPRFSDWNQYEHPIKAVNDDNEVQMWMSKFSEVVRDDMLVSNFYDSWPKVIKDMLIGTGCMLVDEGKANLLNFSSPALGWYSFVEDEEGNAQELYYKYTMNLQQAKYAFGDALPEKIKKKLADPKKSKSFTDEVHFIRCIEPRKPDEFDFSKPMEAAINMPWKSTWVEMDSKKPMRTGGFSSKPFSIQRWDDGVQGAKTERFGWGPARTYISKFKIIHTAESDQITLIQKAARPAWVAPNDSFVNDPDFMPEGINYINTDSTNGNFFKPEPVNALSNPVVMEEYLNRLSVDIKEIFYNDIFEPITMLDDRERTATEIDQRRTEATKSFAIASQRIERMLHEVMVRAGSIVLANSANTNFQDGRLPPPPQALIEASRGSVEFVPKFTSTITQRLKALQNQSLNFSLQRQSILIEVTQGEVIDNVVNVEKAFRQGLLADGVDADILYSEDESMERKKAKQQAMAEQQAAETAKTATEAAGNLPDEQQQQLFEALG